MSAKRSEKHMQRYMVYLHNQSNTPKDAKLLLYRARSLAGDPDLAIVRDVRVSEKYIEFDISVPVNVGIPNVLARLEAISPLASYEHIVERQLEKEQAIKKAIQLFNEEKYWGAHEVLEGIWKSATGREKDILNGIILVAAAFVHDEKDEPDVCLSILRRASEKLAGGSGGIYHGIDIDRMASLVSSMINSGKIERFVI